MNIQLQQASRFRNILLVNRSPRHFQKTEQMVKDGFFYSKILYSEQQQHNKVHTSCLRNLLRIFYEYDFNCTVVNENDLSISDAKDKDLVIAFGGDKTLLRTSSAITDYNLPLLGISTSTNDMEDSTLQDNTFQFMKRREHSRLIAKQLMTPGKLDFFQRSRIHMELETVDKGVDEKGNPVRPKEGEQKKQWFVLNEAFVAEADVASASRYRIKPDNKDLGLFKSSGLIVSTGTGSTGWLFNARQMSTHKVRTIASMFSPEYQSRNLNMTFSRDWSQDSTFSPNSREMFFFVREGFSLTQLTEGFCEKIKITSEMIKGEVVVDGWNHCALGMGDQLTLDVTDNKHDLTMLHLNLD